MVSVEAMRNHIEQLLAPYRIVWLKRAGRARVLRDDDGTVIEVQIPPVRSAITFATALHEIGHILGQYQNSRSVMVRERWAWKWARTNALVWTPAMERHAIDSLKWYEPRAAEIDSKWKPTEESEPVRALCGTRDI